MPQYQVWVENDSYGKVALLRDWQRLEYWQRLNDVASCSVTLHPDDDKIDDIATMKRLSIVRDGSIVWGGLVLRVGWEIPESAPRSERYTVYGWDHAAYAAWRVVYPGTVAAYDTRTGHLDDVLKAYVLHHAGGSAAAARQFSDLYVQANVGSAGSVTLDGRYEYLLTFLQKHSEGTVDWRFVAYSTYCQFETSLLWGYDRTKGNGVNDEAVFTVDRANFLQMRYAEDVSDIGNYVYVGGQGEGVNRNIVERTGTASVSAYKRREKFVDARQLSLTSSLEARGERALEEMARVETMSVKPVATTWKASTGTTWDLGDKVTVYARRWRTFSYDGKVVAVHVTVDNNGMEYVEPVLEDC